MIQPRFMLPEVIGLLAVLAVVLIYFESQQRFDLIYENANRRGDFLSTTLSYQLSDSLFLNNIEQVRKDAEFLIAQGTAQELAIFSDTGQYLFDSRQQQIPTGTTDTELLDRARHADGPLFRKTRDGIEFFDAVMFDDQLLGGFQFEISVKERLDAWHQWVLQTILFAVALFLLTLGIGYLQVRSNRTSQTLREITSRFEQLIERSPLPYATYTTAGDLTYCNPAHRELMAARETTRHCIAPEYNILQDERLRELDVLTAFEEGFSGKEIETPTFAYCDGETGIISPLWLRARIFASDRDDKSQDIAIILEDVSGEKQAEEERARLNATMLQSQKLEGLGVIARGIAHDLNNFLTPVLGHAELLALKLENQPNLGKSARLIMSGARKAADLCDQMLTQAGNTNESRTLTDLSREVRDMSDLVRSSVSKKVTLIVNLDEQLPGILVDKSQLRQIILNMLVNASEAMGEDAGNLKLTTGLADMDARLSANVLPNPNISPGKYVFLEVADTGLGMDKATRESIFNPFFSTKFTGRGLGMSTVLSIVGDHEGGITVQSEPGKGTVFRVYFPATDDVAETGQESLAVSQEKPPQRRRVLFVEDEPAVRNTGRLILETMGYEVTTAVNGKQAVDMYIETNDGFDCVVLDYLMPEQNGRETFFQLREINEDQPVVMVTGLAATQELKELNGQRYLRLLSKPYVGADLDNAILEACKSG